MVEPKLPNADDSIPPLTDKIQILVLLTLGFSIKQSRIKADTMRVVEFFFNEEGVEGGKPLKEVYKAWINGEPVMANMQNLRQAMNTFNYHAMDLHRHG